MTVVVIIIDIIVHQIHKTMHNIHIIVIVFNYFDTLGLFHGLMEMRK